MKKQTEGCSSDRAETVAAEAEGLYRSGKMHCAEAVLTAVIRNCAPGAGEETARLAAGFGGGSGAGCICGAIVGGTMAFGLVSGDDRNRVRRLTGELHRWFREEFGETCCRVILKTHGKKCFELTGKVAGKVASMIEWG